MLTIWRKQQARKRALKTRLAAHKADPQAGERLAARFPDALWPPLHSVVAGYRPVRGEIDPGPLMETFWCEQARLALPCVDGPDQPLTFRAWAPGDELETGAYGIETPGAGAQTLTPALILVPLLAFDHEGRRLGYGGGYYDRTLASLRAQGPVTAVGLAYAAQRMKRVPCAGHDMRLDWIVTEEGALKAGS
ncbi:5-formyltetrahydrofolate cyclo-ligase [Alkalicaulis satelles]|uniref:5-formyltetrahydrofolate cyclo-ligase n=1 Tax=Alkalicaulis satelles TaxID=2609175 RepID=A0A5M6ZGU6_9PROT|nr:5-formyltetrahydrofolate cyclo-ligase [Alkalicaulis satelles]KAA5803949.1 5-formyltetrahydrofolate cyclo-ligase [Alkalicaulis satelles]